MEKNEFSELINQARSTDLLNYFQSSGYKIEQHCNNYYIKEFPGLCIKPEKNQWYNHYTNEGRTNNSVDCLTNICGRTFNQAVFELTGKDISNIKSSENKNKYKPEYTSPIRKTESEKINKELKMPERSANMRRLFAYFCQSRKIPAEIVEEMVHRDLLYQSESNFIGSVKGEQKSFINANAIFVHKDPEGKIIGAEIQGCNSYKRYKGVASGTGESAFIFNPLQSGQIKRAYIFESAIDLMSFYTFCNKQKLVGSILVSMAGLKPAVPKKLESEGIQIISCVDNDDAGRRFEKENEFVRSESVKNYLDNNGFKDWNELLIYKTANPNYELLNTKSETQNSTIETNDDEDDEIEISRGR